MAPHEREFYNEKAEKRATPLTCPFCRRRHDYDVAWIRRTRRGRIPSGADARDRAMYPKLRDYPIRAEDVIVCKTCRRRFEIPSQQSLVFLQ
jgi:uncharacterized protein YbaR (Trm112 family)